MLSTARSSVINRKLEMFTGSWGWRRWFRFAPHANFSLLVSLPKELFQITKKGDKFDLMKASKWFSIWLYCLLIWHYRLKRWESQTVSNLDGLHILCFLNLSVGHCLAWTHLGLSKHLLAGWTTGQMDRWTEAKEMHINPCWLIYNQEL